ncbi:uncharacterized protein RCC_02491 [Ramularia collo-cygni]|uniref:C2H2-type domain-containing protein n=1 Tax=Ramularia collo-cygni TaxID=112498 RepID=A0A2D3UZI4_9PEZI|nr:uncharacterized protein RCC_02491 [Ramularia collo-cygni]CZT16656.1 uncharacterized protein RCC_02491 [Ramularia collo-cygni]
MTFRTREDYLAASEEFAPFHQTGSVLFAQPSEVTHWCQSVPNPEGYPLTPPDTVSDCSASDYSDMAPTSWNMTSMSGADGWTTEPVQDNSTRMQPSASSQYTQGTPVTSQDLHAMDAASWTHSANGPVDQGLSPVLSHESQSSRTLNSFSEPDVNYLPPGLDLSFIGENSWQTPAAYSGSSCVPQDYPSSISAPPQHMPYAATTGPLGYDAPSHIACVPQQSAIYFQDVHGSNPGMSECDQSMIHGRPLLPRTDDHPFQGVPPTAGYVAFQPEHADFQGRVSSSPILPRQAFTSSRPLSTRSGMYMEPIPQAGKGSPIGQLPTPCSDSTPFGIPPSLGSVNEDFSSFIQYDQEEKAPAMSHSHSGYGPAECRSALASPEQDGISRSVAASSHGPTIPETDEGRYRNHPLYSEGPHADGLYHCPFKSDPSCQHKATKLKCNYDKFIDSHLKPFRCKVEACSKQEFSSTACLLRHEREAHGMHGHGERPHLCFYPGCERGMSGNGFPRRYNLYDHMKRVHDHKDDPSTGSQEKPTAGSQTQRKSGSRKRTASSTNEEPAAQRVKVQPAREPVPMVAAAPSPRTLECNDARSGIPRQRDNNNNNRQRVLYSQWAQQRELVNFQMSSVQGPDDEDNLQRLSQNIEELRRLSQQARQG